MSLTHKDRGPVARRKAAENRRVEPVLDRKDACGKGRFIVTRQHGNPGLTEDGTGIQLGGDLVDRAAGLGIARGKGAGVGVKARISRQQRGVDVKHLPFMALNEAVGEDSHEAGKAEDVRPGSVDMAGKRGLEGFAILAEGAMIDGGSRDTKGRGFGKTPGSGIVRGDKDRLRGVVMAHVADQRQHVRATPGDQDGDAFQESVPR